VKRKECRKIGLSVHRGTTLQEYIYMWLDHYIKTCKLLHVFNTRHNNFPLYTHMFIYELHTNTATVLLI
jgi:hypothetical protein